MPNHFPIWMNTNKRDMGFTDMADIDLNVGFSRHNSHHIGNVRVTQEVIDKNTRRFRLYVDDKLMSTKHITRQ